MAPFVAGRTSYVQWQCRQEWAPMLFGPEGLRMGDWLAEGQVDVVKHGPHRSVYRFEVGGREFYVKHFRSHTIWDRLRRWFRLTPARREWLKAKEITSRGVSTIRPVAWQEGSAGGPAGESFLVTEAIPGGCPLDEFCEKHLPLLPPLERQAVRRRLIVEAAQFLAKVHQAGIRHDDLHPGNLVVPLEEQKLLVDRETQRYRLHLIDVPSVRFSGPLPWSVVRQGLVVLNAAWGRRISLADRYRFWKAYLDARPGIKVPSLREVAGQLQHRTERHCRRRLWRRDRRTMRTCRDFVTLRTSQGRVHGVSELHGEAVRELSADPETLLWQNMHRPVKLDRGNVIVEADLPLQDRTVHVAYKRYRPRKWWKGLLAPFRPARAVQGWQRGHGLRLREIPAARPVMAVDRRRPWYRCESYLAVEWIENSENLHLYLWRMIREPEVVRMRQANLCAESLGRLLGRMHAQRVIHGDLKASNLLITDRDGRIDSYLIDADDVCLDVDTTLSRRAADLARLAASLEAHSWVSRAVRMRFLRAYVEESGRGTPDWKHLWRAVGKRTESITRRKRRKKQVIL